MKFHYLDLFNGKGGGYSRVIVKSSLYLFNRMQSSGMIDVELERPKTSKGRRNRPTSRLGRRPVHDKTDDLEGDNGRPASRRGFTPETYERYF